MTILGPICVLICFVGLVSYYWTVLAAEKAVYDWRWYRNWLAKGLVFPIVVWFLLNVGHSPVMPAVVKVTPRQNIAPPPTIIYPPNAPPNTPPIIVPSKPKYIGVGPIAYVVIETTAAFIVIGSFWGALTLGWFLTHLVQRVENRRNFFIGSLICSAVLSPLVFLIFWYNGPGAIGFALTLWILPILHYLTLLEIEPEPVPHYTSAVVKIKFGKYAEAEQDIIKELEKCENDFDGWLMLAELYARQFDDVGEAERTLRDLCDEPATTISQVAVALHKLADWQLLYRSDPHAARRALEEIVKRMPGTHLAKMAQLRIGQLPKSHEEMVDRQRGKRISMPALSEDFDDAPEENLSEAGIAEAQRVADQCVEKLKRDPNDIGAREKLARIFAERLGQAGLGVNQLELLMEMPGHPAAKTAEWLGLMAIWQIKYLDNKEAAQKLLQRLIREFPQSAQAFAAQRRLKLIEMEAR